MEETAALLIIGDEILAGKVRDMNSAFLVSELRELGMRVLRIETIPDDEEEIAATVRRLSAAHDHVLSSGGVGPTPDDVTFAGIARAFGDELVEREEIASVVRAHYGDALCPSHLRLARVPREAILDWSEGIPWPAVIVRNVLVLPGSPEILRRKFLALRERFRRTPIHQARIVTCLDEGALAPILEKIGAAFASVRLGSYPSYARGDVTLTLEGREAGAIRAAAAALAEAIGRANVSVLETPGPEPPGRDAPGGG